MVIFKSKNQKDNAAKYCYDISKLWAAITVITPLVKNGFSKIWLIFSGIVITLLFFLAGYILDNDEV